MNLISELAGKQEKKIAMTNTGRLNKEKPSILKSCVVHSSISYNMDVLNLLTIFMGRLADFSLSRNIHYVLRKLADRGIIRGEDQMTA